LVVRAGDLAERHGLLGYGAVHLAAAIEVGPDVVASADVALCRAAAAHGLHAPPPGDHPSG
jgi:predicted nucleic acid-binding protein